MCPWGKGGTRMEARRKRVGPQLPRSPPATVLPVVPGELLTLEIPNLLFSPGLGEEEPRVKIRPVGIFDLVFFRNAVKFNKLDIQLSKV